MQWREKNGNEMEENIPNKKYIFFIIIIRARARVHRRCSSYACTLCLECVCVCSGRNQFVLHKNKVHLRLAVPFLFYRI